MSPDTEELAVRMARVNAKVLEIQAKVDREAKEAEEIERLTEKRNGFWIAAGVFFGVAVTLSILYWTHTVPVPNGVISWLGAGLTVISLLGGIATQNSINHRKATKRTEDAETRLRDEIRDARPADTVALGELATELQASRSLIAQLLDAVSHNERQRQSDFDQIRENSRKALEGLHEDVERLGSAVVERLLDVAKEWLPGAVEDATRKGYAAGYTDALAATGGNQRPLRPVRDQDNR